MSSETRILIARCLHLGGTVAVLWLLLLFPVYRIGGTEAVFGSSLAAVLCLVPGWLVFLVASRYRDMGTQMPIVVIGGSVLRLLFVLVGMFSVQATWDGLGFKEFVLWLLVFYMATLAVETRLMLKGLTAAKKSPAPDVT